MYQTSGFVALGCYFSLRFLFRLILVFDEVKEELLDDEVLFESIGVLKEASMSGFFD